MIHSVFRFFAAIRDQVLVRLIASAAMDTDERKKIEEADVLAADEDIAAITALRQQLDSAVEAAVPEQSKVSVWIDRFTTCRCTVPRRMFCATCTV